MPQQASMLFFLAVRRVDVWVCAHHYLGTHVGLCAEQRVGRDRGGGAGVSNNREMPAGSSVQHHNGRSGPEHVQPGTVFAVAGVKERLCV